MKKKIIFLLLLVLLLTLPLGVLADMGPKDKLTVRLQNPPEENYYLDLLTTVPGTYDNLEYDDNTFDPALLERLQSYNADGWSAAYSGGTNAPLFGDLIGFAEGTERIHIFSYAGLPETYRIIVVTESGKTVVSETMKRAALQSSVRFDYAAAEAVTPPILLTYAVQLLSTFIPTLLIEGLLLRLFGFSIKENFKVFFLANLLTQILLTLTLGITLIKSGTVAVSFAQFPVELLIMIFETTVYARMLKGKGKTRAIAYGVTANAASWLIGYLTLYAQFGFLVTLL